MSEVKCLTVGKRLVVSDCGVQRAVDGVHGGQTHNVSRAGQTRDCLEVGGDILTKEEAEVHSDETEVMSGNVVESPCNEKADGGVTVTGPLLKVKQSGTMSVSDVAGMLAME